MYNCTGNDDDYVVAILKETGNCEIYIYADHEDHSVFLTKQDAISFAREILALCGESE